MGHGQHHDPVEHLNENPDVSSSFGVGWALAAIAWGAVFVAVALLIEPGGRPAPAGSPGSGMVGTLTVEGTT